MARPGQIAALKAAIASIGLRARSAAPVDVSAIRRAVAEEVGRLSGCPAEHVRENKSLFDVYGLDALDRLQLALAVEGRLMLREGCIEHATLRTVGDVMRAAQAAR